MAEERRWVFETGTQRYRDLATGRFLSSTDVIGIVNGIADRTTGDPVTTINTMLADGRLNTADWKTGFARQIKNAYIQQAELAAGGRSQMTPQMWGSVGGSVREQYRYLDKFAKQIESKQLTPAQIEARTKMYINSSRESFWRIKDMKAAGAGMTEEKWNAIGDDSTCGPCSDAGSMGWQPIGTFAQPGSGRVMVKPRTNCQGLTNCRCEKEYRKGAAAGQEGQQEPGQEESTQPIAPTTAPSGIAPEQTMQTSEQIIQNLKGQGYDIAYSSVDEIIDAEWRSFSKSDSFERSVQEEFGKIRSGIRRTIPTDLIRQWRQDGVSTEEIRNRIDQWTLSELEKRRGKIVSDIRNRFYKFNTAKFAGKDVIVQSPGELGAFANGLDEAYRAGNISSDATYIFRNPLQNEVWISGQHLEGRINIYNGGYVELGILDDKGRVISTSDVYRLRSIEEPTFSVPQIYTNRIDGIATHEYGHYVGYRDPEIGIRATKALGEFGEEIKSLISEYAYTDSREMVAESYALYRHPDYGKLPTQSKRIIEFVLFGGER